MIAFQWSAPVLFGIPNLKFYSIQSGLSKARGITVIGWLKSLFLGDVTVISRGLCTFESVSINPKISRRDAKNAIYLNAVNTSPFQDPGVFLKMGHTQACVWTWDKDKLFNETGRSSRGVVPETALLGAVEEGLLLHRCLDGFEGQIWRNHELVKSQWWPREIDEQQWSLFSLSGDYAVDDYVEMPDAYALSTLPKTVPTNEIPIRYVFQNIRIREYAAVLGAVVFLFLSYFVLRYAYLDREITRKETQLAELWAEKAEERAVLSELTKAQEVSTEIARLYGQAHPLPSLSKAITMIQEMQAKIHQVNYEQGGYRLVFIQSNAFDQTALVRALENDADITGVTLESMALRDGWTVSFEDASRQESVQ